MRDDEITALGELAAEAAMGVAAQARDVHAGVAERVFATLGAPAAQVRGIHDAIAGGAYAAGRWLTGALVRGAAFGLAAARRGETSGLADGPLGRMVLAALCAVRGDRLAEQGSVLAAPLSLILDRRPRALTGRLVVFIHGLGETEDAWRRGAERHPPYGDRLAAEHGFTVIYVRYNTGRAIAGTGAELSAALEDAVAGWPVPVQEIVLVGHSMGGLVARAACHHGRGHAWSDRVRRVVTLGSPHTGAPLARAAHHAERVLGALPETRPFAAPLRARSASIRDLRDGSDLPFAPGVDHHFVAATVTRDPESPVGRLLGDLLVERRSAWAQRTATERRRFSADHYAHLGAAHHLDLLNHPAVYERLSEIVSPPPPQRP